MLFFVILRRKLSERDLEVLIVYLSGLDDWTDGHALRAVAGFTDID